MPHQMNLMDVAAAVLEENLKEPELISKSAPPASALPPWKPRTQESKDLEAACKKKSAELDKLQAENDLRMTGHPTKWTGTQEQRREHWKMMAMIHVTEEFQGMQKNLQEPNFYRALQRAFSDALLEISEEQLKQFKLQKGEQLYYPATLLKIWAQFCHTGQDLDTAGQNALATFIGDDKITGSDPLMSPNFDSLGQQEQDHQQVFSKCIMGCPCNQTTRYLPMTLEFRIDALMLEMDYRASTLGLTFEEWLQHVGILRFIKETRCRISEPQLLREQTSRRGFLLSNWMVDYWQTRICFEDWYESVGKCLKRPTPETSMVKFPPFNKNTRIIYRNFQEAGIADTDYNAWRYQTQLDCEEVQRQEFPHQQVIKDFRSQSLCQSRGLQCPSPPPLDVDTLISKLRIMDALTGNQDNVLTKEEQNQLAAQMAITPAPGPLLEVTPQNQGSQTDSSSPHISWADDIPDVPAPIQCVKQVLDRLTTQMGPALEGPQARQQTPEPDMENTIEAIFKTAGYKLPAMNRTFWEHDAVTANFVPHMDVQKPLVFSDDFMPGGKFSHIYIPPYVLVPLEIQLDLQVQVAQQSAALYNLWRQCHVARFRADRRMKNFIHKTLHTSKPTLWHDLLTGKASKTFASNIIDRVQHSEAWRKSRLRNGNLSNMQTYDWFYRPLERIVALNMPMSALLIKATRNKPAAELLIEALSRMVGFHSKPSCLTTEEIVTEMSQTRAFRVEDYQLRSTEDRPTH
jgi:hypothetical protein